MQLLFLFDASVKERQVKDIDHYKYREETRMVFTDDNATRLALIGAAYTAIHLPAFDKYEVSSMEALQCAVPLISMETPFCRASFEAAALYCTANEKDLSEKMILLYKDENYRNQLIENGNSWVKASVEKNSADSIWNALLDSLDA